MEGLEPNYVNINSDDESSSCVDVSENEMDYETNILDLHDEDKRNVIFPEVSSLQNTCLRCISENFDRFNYAYSTSSDDNLRRQLLFLQRKFSRYFLLEKSIDGYLDQSYLKFLINEHLKELYVDVISRCDWKDVLKCIAEVGHGLGKVSFHGVTLNGDGLKFADEMIGHFHNLESLNVSIICNDQILKTIASTCPRLKELNISESKVTSNGLKFLCPEVGGVAEPKLANLKVLSMTNVPDANSECAIDCIKYLLKNVPSLEVLNHKQLPDTLYHLYLEEKVDNINKFNISKLDLCHILSDDVLKAVIVTCPRLKLIGILLCQQDQVMLLSQLTELEKLYIDNGSHNVNLAPLLKTIGNGLKTLSICDISISVPVLIQCCPKLESLSLISVNYQSEPGNTTAKLYNLRELCIDFLDCSDTVSSKAAIQVLTASPNLEKIVMENYECDQPDDIKTILSQCCRSSVLKELIFKNCTVNETILKSILLTCVSLQKLTITGCAAAGYSTVLCLQQIAKTIKNCIEIIYIDEFGNISHSHRFDYLIDRFEIAKPDYCQPLDCGCYVSDYVYGILDFGYKMQGS